MTKTPEHHEAEAERLLQEVVNTSSDTLAQVRATRALAHATLAQSLRQGERADALRDWPDTGPS